MGQKMERESGSSSRRRSNRRGEERAGIEGQKEEETRE